MNSFAEMKTLTVSLPAFLLGSEMMEFGFSLAGVALADGQVEIDAAIDAVRHTITEFRQAFGAARPHIDGFIDWIKMRPGLALRDSLEQTGVLEKAAIDLAAMVGQLMNPRFQSIFNASHDASILPDIQRTLTEMYNNHLPMIRRLRMELVKEVYSRAERHGVENSRLPADFSVSFLTASHDEIESWHETAYLMCDLENLSMLARSMSQESEDRTDQFRTANAGVSPAA